MIDMRSGRADDLEESGDESEVVVDEVESRRPLGLFSINFTRISYVETRRTSNHFAATSNPSTASLTVPSTLRTSSQNKTFSSRNRCRTEVIFGTWAGTVRGSMRCLCHDWHAYRKL